MASLFGDNGVDYSQLPDDDGFAVMPPGEYVCRITDSDVKLNNSGTGRYLKLTLKIEEGEYSGRLVWDMLNIQHNNPTAQRIGQGALKRYMKACGIESTLQDSTQLHNIPFVAALKIVPDDREGEKNAVKNVKPYQNPQPPVNPNYQNSAPSQHATTPSGGQPAQGQPANNAPPASGAGGLPWEQNG